MSVVLHLAEKADAPAIAAILTGWIDEIDWMPRVHAPSQYMGYSEMLMTVATTTVARREGRVVGFLARQMGDIQGLYVDKACRGTGVGADLLNAAQAEVSQLGVWSFQANTGARRFYARHGFIENQLTDGQGNDEKLADVHLSWAENKNG